MPRPGGRTRDLFNFGLYSLHLAAPKTTRLLLPPFQTRFFVGSCNSVPIFLLERLQRLHIKYNHKGELKDCDRLKQWLDVILSQKIFFWRSVSVSVANERNSRSSFFLLFCHICIFAELRHSWILMRRPDRRSGPSRFRRRKNISC